MSDQPIACRLSQAEQRERQQALQVTLFAAVLRRQELADGYEFHFPAGDEIAEQLLAFVSFERQCCPFFTFELALSPAGNTLRLRGSPEIKTFVEQTFT